MKKKTYKYYLPNGVLYCESTDGEIKFNLESLPALKNLQIKSDKEEIEYGD